MSEEGKIGNTYAAQYLVRHGHLPPEISKANLPKQRVFLCGDELKVVTAKLANHSAMMIAMSIRGVSQHEIAAAMGVSRESVARRLRKAGTLRGRGRPRKDEV